MRLFRVLFVAMVVAAAGLVPAAASTSTTASIPAADRPLTVVAVVDSGFTVYHYDFLGHRHPWNTDADPGNNFDFTADPATYIEGYPGSAPISVTIPSSPSTRVDQLKATDAAAWGTMRTSTLADPKIYRFPGTKIIAALDFTSAATFEAGNSAHGTRSAASAAGNVHGTCPECLFVLVRGSVGLAWAAAQPWIDVVTNSYGASLVGNNVRDNVNFGSPLDATRAASTAGQTIVFSAGNGLLNAFDVPMFTYWSSEKGPDWMVTVGAVSSFSHQTYLGSGKPVDVSSIGDQYPSTGGLTANGFGEHSGTSNAAPVVAGTLAKVLQRARTLLSDTTETHANGVVASGGALACGAADPTCPLSDGTLTRRELEDALYSRIAPSPRATRVQTIPTQEHAYYYQGHGVVRGLDQTTAAFAAEQSKILGSLDGTSAPIPRPLGEQNWFVTDSYCRQKIWGFWEYGLFRRGNVAPGAPQTPSDGDDVAPAFGTACQALPDEVGHDAAPILAPILKVLSDTIFTPIQQLP